MLIPTINSGRVRTTQALGAILTANGGFSYRNADGALYVTDINSFTPPISYVGGVAVDALGAVVTTIIDPIGAFFYNNGLNCNAIGQVLVDPTTAIDFYAQGLPYAVVAGIPRLCINEVA